MKLSKLSKTEQEFLERKTYSALGHYKDGVPLKDVWNDEDTIMLMETFLSITGWSDE